MALWKRPRLMLILLLGVILLFGCAASTGNSNLAEAPEIPNALTAPGQQTTPAPEPKLPRDLPNAFSQLIPFDGIYPIYDPFFVPGQEAPYADDELILGVAWGGEAKAYPISVLRFREMVDDELAGIPTLVTY
jgi:hypothetical protein